MSAPVWLLSVDLQAKTAVFTSGLADAAKKARGSFQDIKSGAQDMSDGSSRGFSDIRHSLGLLDNSIRGQHGAAMADAIRLTAQFVDVSSALPFAAMAGGFILVGGLIVEAAKKIQEYRQEQENLVDAQTRFGIESNNAFNALDRKILEAGIRADELNHDHLGALLKQLKLIDMQSMDDLVHSFDQIAKGADGTLNEIKKHWHIFGSGAEGAQHALSQFKNQYDLLLSEGKDKEASDLLAGTRRSAEHILALQKEAKSLGSQIEGTSGTRPDEAFQFERDRAELKKVGMSYSQDDLALQQAIVKALGDQASQEDRVNKAKGLDKSNARQSSANASGSEAFAALRAQWDADRKAQEDSARLNEEAHNRAVAELEQSERAKIEATEKGSAERLAAIAGALKEEETYGLQETSFYRDLLTQRVEIARQMADEEEKQKAEAGKEAADNAAKMAEIALAGQKEHQQLIDSARRKTVQQQIAEALQASNAELAIKMTAFSQEIAALDKNDKDYENKLRAIQDKEKQLTAQHENEVTSIQNQAALQRNKTILDAETRFQDEMARGLTSTLMRHQSFASVFISVGNQIASGMIQNAIQSIMANDMTKESDAAAAARKAFNAGMHFPFPVNIAMAPALGAMAFASVMAFEKGGIVPGVGLGDVVPAMVTPGEIVLPKFLSEGLTNAARSGNLGSSGPHYTIHVRPTYHVNTLDQNGVQDVLDKHADTLQKHFESTVRRMHGR